LEGKKKGKRGRGKKRRDYKKIKGELMWVVAYPSA